MRLPIIPSDKNSPGTILSDFMHFKMSPGQLRFHCHGATKQMRIQFAALKRPTALYSPRQPIGHNTVTAYFRDLGNRLGIKDLTGHSLRALCITRLVNGGVGIQEVMNSARHSSVSASSVYQMRTGESQAKKFKALGVSIPDGPPSKPN
jgi:integrase